MAAFIAAAAPFPRLGAAHRNHQPFALHRRRRRCPVAASPRASFGADASRASPPDVRALVDAVLATTRDADGGTRLTAAQQRSTEAIIRTLNQIGSYRRNALTDASIFSNYSVVYTSQKQGSPAAGGRFRTAFARLFLKSTGLFQHLLAPDVVVNLVCFRIVGFLDACVALKGTFSALEEQSNVVRVLFEPPRMRIGNAVFQFGSASSVRLSATYLDDRLRLGVGGRGSLFAFAKDERANSQLAQQWRYMFDAKALSPLLLLVPPLLLLASLCVKAWSVRLGSLVALGAVAFILGNSERKQKL